MKFRNKINWVITWLAMAMLKRSLKYRICGENKYWLQNVPAKAVSLFNRADFIVAQCNDKKVLHIGFSDYPYTMEKINNQSLLHLQLKNISRSILGLDNNKEALQQYQRITKDENIVFGDITTHYPFEATNFHPDIILLSEVLEHLPEPSKAVDILYDSFPNATRVIVTVPNYISLDSIAASIHQTESLHPHHYSYYSPFTLCKLFDDKRFHLQELHFGMYYQTGKKVNFAMRNFPYNGDCIMAIFLINKT